MRKAVLAGLLAAACAASDRAVQVPWQPGFADAFQQGTPAENGVRAMQGNLPVRLVLPEGQGPFPFVVLLHGCDGRRPRWSQPWAALLRAHGIGSAEVDSLAPRGVDQVCTRDAGAWARRRADDAHAVRSWLAAQPFVQHDRIAVMGMSNGGRSVLAALREPQPNGRAFRAGVALYPGCQSDVASRFATPLLVLIGRADSVTPARTCEAMRAAQPDGTALTLHVYPGAPHSFDVDAPARRYLGMELAPDPAAAADARQRVVGFLEAQGIGR